MRGSKKSREQHIRDGTYHDYHHAPVKVGDRLVELSPYKELTEIAQEIFFSFAEEMNSMGILKPEDMSLITHLAEDAELMLISKRLIDDQGIQVVDDKGNAKENPSVRTYYRAKDSFGKIAKSLGIGPLARQKLYDARIMSGTEEQDLNLD